ncbi:hypothetical protein Dtox_2686 [Desulfofarcimen acetoxidans DSM 771]|uniref:NERD domain-containing protein n=1 Tax=Desulfofarcimen acetoxidans (strain ATCC 49208 / DSM 771 / KCTC 5769 / VKM B-1644 / 5575) TaxID=485916 RepID=C8W170_DESAS|nr:DUF6661 family protein [Desulfofarcimen acetoxidans]ACV63466.1 hypothetical protein Dtox_2686 [Desulfofarcimen acetoxidans DSM 771]
MRIDESGIVFEFNDKLTVDKFDDTGYYQNYFKKLTGGKGVDFILNSDDTLMLIEVKNCAGYESDNRWRIFANNSKRDTTATMVDTDDRDSLDIEIPKKVAMTLACLCGAHSQPQFQTHSNVLKKYFNFIRSNNISSEKNKIKIVLFLEGDFASKKMPQKLILTTLGRKIKEKLSWLNCNIIVENIESHHNNYYTASIIK